MSKFIIFFFLAVNVLGGDYEALLKVDSEKLVKNGDSFNFTLELNQAIPEAALNKIFEKNEEKLGFIHIVEIRGVDLAKNEIKLKGIYENIVNKDEIFLKSEDDNLKIKVNNLERFSKEKINEKRGFHFYSRDPEQTSSISKNTAKYILISLLLLILIGSSWWLATSKKRRSSKKRKKEERYWRETFSKAKKRDDFESIYHNKNKWMKMFSADSSFFFKIINKYQYQEKWSDEELNEVRLAFSRFRNGI